MSVVSDAIKDISGRARDVSNRTGLWPGRVEDVNDPKRLGRVRVRIFHLHGDKRATATTALPWAEVSDTGGGGHDFGSAGNLYPVGSTVWVMFVLGDERFPVVTGGRRGAPVRDGKNPVEFMTVGGTSQDGVSTPWLPPEGNEIPKDVYDESAEGDSLPTRTVWHKSLKGHTILVEDRDGSEFLKIIDRAGQVIEMNCPVTTDANKNNAQQRGARNASNDSQLPQSVLVNQKAFVRIKDVGGNEVLLDGSGGNEKIVLTSRNRQGTSQQQLVLSSAKGRETIYFQDKQGNKIQIDPNNPAASVVIEDFTGNQITFDAEAGKLILKATTQEVHEVGGLDTTVRADRSELIGGSDKTKVAGNKFLDVLNDLAASISGMTSVVAGGAVQFAVANMPASGVPATTALSVDIALGAIALTSQMTVDPMAFKTLAGNVELGTLAGNVEATTLAGNVKVTTLAGTAEFGTIAGQTTIDGALGVMLGSVAPFSIAYGEGVLAVLSTFFAALASDSGTGAAILPATYAALPTLAPLMLPGIMFSLLNKTA